MDGKLTARCRGLTGALTSESFKISVPEVSISLENQKHRLEICLQLLIVIFAFNPPHLGVFHWQSAKK